MAQTANEEGPHMLSYLIRVTGETEASSRSHCDMWEEERAGDQMEGSAFKFCSCRAAGPCPLDSHQTSGPNKVVSHAHG